LERCVLRPAVVAAPIDPAKSFLDHKKYYDASDLLRLMQRMPKGAVLHTHGIASGDFTALVAAIQKNGHFFVWQGDDSTIEGSMRAFASKSDATKGWVPAESFPADRLYKYLTLASNLPSVEVCWQEFGKIWERVRHVASVAPFYFGRNGILWDTLTKTKEANVMYFEIKEPLFEPFTDYNGCALTDDEMLKAFCDTVDEFKAEYPGFLGARLVLTSLKCETDAAIRKAYRRAVAMKAKSPDFVAGFDTAGPEDVFRPIEEFAHVLEAERATAKADGVDLPLLLHAGETNVPEATQVFDAVALGCERIGHGFAIARHPVLLDDIKASGMSLECCPISNQVLGYVSDLANHPALGLMRSGVPLTISPDDPGMWHYCDVSYDFAAVAKAWNLQLVELKALARNSLAFSTLRGQQMDVAVKAWEVQWDLWVKEENRKADCTTV